MKYILVLLLVLSLASKAQIPTQFTVVHIVVSIDSIGKYDYVLNNYVLCDNRYNLKISPSNTGTIHIAVLNTNNAGICYFKSDYDDPLLEDEKDMYIRIPVRPENITIKIWHDLIDTKYLKITK